jgi:hypothetical protein
MSTRRGNPVELFDPSPCGAPARGLRQFPGDRHAPTAEGAVAASAGPDSNSAGALESGVAESLSGGWQPF